MHDPITTNHLDENEDNISEDDHTYSLSSSSSTYSSTNDEFIPSPKTSENLIVNNQEEEERESLHRQQQQQQEPTIHFAAFPQRPTIHTGEHGWCQQEREDWESVDEYEQDDESILEKIINSISFFYTRISLWFQDKKLQWQRGRPLTPRSRRIAEVPFCMATFGSIYGTFILVRAAAVNGWIVDHSQWDGTGHEFDKNPVVSINKLETLAIYISLFCGIVISILLIARTRMSLYFVSKWCLWLAYVQGVLCLSTVYGFTLRSNASFILNNNPTYVYSRGFWSGLCSSIMFFLAAFSFTVDRLLSYPYSKLSIVLKGLVLPSVMLCSTVIIGALTYMTLEDWTYSKSILFCWTGITTIGYGDITPSSSKGRIFFLLYTVFGISIVGYMLLSIRAVITGTSSDIMKVNLMRVESLHDYSRHQRQKWMNQQNCRQQLFDNTNNNSNSPTTPLLERRYSTPIETPITGREDDITDHTNDHDNTYSSNLTSPYPNYNNNNDKNFQGRGPRSLSNVSTFSTYTIAGILNNKDRQILVQVITKSGIVKMGIILIICWFGGAGIFCSLEKDWSYLDGLYFVFGTQLTIGFGDIVPQTALAQEFWLAYIIVSIAVAAYFISLCGDTLIEKLQIQDDNEDPESLFYTDEIAGSPPPMDDYTDNIAYNDSSGLERNLVLDNNGIDKDDQVSPSLIQPPTPRRTFSASSIDKQDTDSTNNNDKRTTAPVYNNRNNVSPPVLFQRSQLVRHSSLPNVSTRIQQQQQNVLNEVGSEGGVGPIRRKRSFSSKRKQHPLRTVHKLPTQTSSASASSSNIPVITTITTTPTSTSSSNNSKATQTRTNNRIQNQQEDTRRSKRHHQYGSIVDTRNPISSACATASSSDVGYFNLNHHKKLECLKHPTSPSSLSEEQQEIPISSPSTNTDEVILKDGHQKQKQQEKQNYSLVATDSVNGQQEQTTTYPHTNKKKKVSKYLPIAVTDSHCYSVNKKHHSK